MFAILAVITFAIGLILELFSDVGNNWVILFLGLVFVGVHFIWSWTPWAARSGPG